MEIPVNPSDHQALQASMLAEMLAMTKNTEAPRWARWAREPRDAAELNREFSPPLPLDF